MNKRTLFCWIVIVHIVVGMEAAPIPNVRKGKPQFDTIVGKVVAGLSAASTIFGIVGAAVGKKGKQVKRRLKRTFKKKEKFNHFVKADDGNFCSCERQHVDTFHVVGPFELVRQTFTYTYQGHSHKYLYFACLSLNCCTQQAVAELYTPMQIPVMTQIEGLTRVNLQIDSRITHKETNNMFHQRNLTADITNIKFVTNDRNHIQVLPLKPSARYVEQTLAVRIRTLNCSVVGEISMARAIDIFHSEKPRYFVTSFPKYQALADLLHRCNETIVPFSKLKQHHTLYGPLSLKYEIAANFDGAKDMYFFPHHDLEVYYADGKRYQITNIFSKPQILQQLIQSQGVELVKDIRRCKTTRCLVTTPNSGRFKRALQCDTWFIWTTCEDGVSTEQLKQAITTYGKEQQKIFGKAIQETNDRLLTAVDAITVAMEETQRNIQTIVTQVNSFQKRFGTNLRTLDSKITKIQAMTDIKDKILHFKINIMSALIMQRLHANEVMQKTRLYDRLKWNAFECLRGDCQSLEQDLARIDAELTTILRNRFPIHPTIHFSDRLNIIYTKPRGYIEQRQFVMIKPKITIAQNCSQDNFCSQCIIQAPAIPQLDYSQELTFPQNATVILTPFELTSCPKPIDSLPELVFPIGKNCLRISTEESKIIPCPVSVSKTSSALISFVADTPDMDIRIYPTQVANLSQVVLRSSPALQQLRQLSLKLKSEVDESMNMMYTSADHLNTLNFYTTEGVNWTLMLAILALVLSILMSLAFVGQFLYIKYCFRQPKPRINYKKNPINNMVTKVKNKKFRHRKLKYSLTNGHITIIFTLHSDVEQCTLIKDHETLAIFTPTMHIPLQPGLEIKTVISNEECDCLSPGLIIINDANQVYPNLQ